MRKENLVKCEICGREFNNAYRFGVRRFACSQDCYLKLRVIKRKESIKKSQVKRKQRWKENVKKHLCGDCGKKVKPIIRYPSRCKTCRDKIRYNRRKKINNKKRFN